MFTACVVLSVANHVCHSHWTLFLQHVDASSLAPQLLNSVVAELGNVLSAELR